MIQRIRLIAALLTLGWALALTGAGCDATTEPAAGEEPDDGTFGAVAGAVPTSLGGYAYDIGVAANTGQAWIVGTDHAVWSRSGASWVQVPAWASAISVSPDGMPWVIGYGNAIYRLTQAGWVQLPGSGIDIGIGTKGETWLVGTDNQLWSYDAANNGWVPHGGSVTRVCVAKDGAPWVIASGNAIYRWTSAAWEYMYGWGIDIGCGADGSIYTIGTNGLTYQWNGGGWTYQSVLGSGNRAIAVDPLGDPWWVASDYGVWAQIPDSKLLAPFLTTAQQAALSCTRQLGAGNSHSVTCTSAVGGPAVSLSNLTGTVTSPSNYTLSTSVQNLGTVMPGVSGILDFVNGNLFTGANAAVVTLYGPDNGNKAEVTATIGFGSYFQPLDDAVQGLTGGAVSFMADQFPVKATLQNGVVTAQIQLLPTSAHPAVSFTEPSTGLFTQVDSLTLTYVSSPKEVRVVGTGKFKLAANDPVASIAINYSRKADGDVAVSGTLQNLGKPFGGLVPLTLDTGSFDAALGTNDKGKKTIKKLAITIGQARLFDHVVLGGSFMVDKLSSPNVLQFALTYKICGQWNTLAFNSTDWQSIPQQMITVLTNAGKSIAYCTDNATCPAGYTKTGLQCDKTCPAGYTNSPGLCVHATQVCPNPTVGYVWPNCKNPGSCGVGSHPVDGILGKNDICAYTCGDVGLPGALPSCINPDNARPLIWPQ